MNSHLLLLIILLYWKPKHCGCNCGTSIFMYGYDEDNLLVVIHFYEFTQMWLERIYREFPQKRDFYNRNTPGYMNGELNV